MNVLLKPVPGAALSCLAAAAIFSMLCVASVPAARAQDNPPECFQVPPRCQTAQQKAGDYGNQMISKIQQLGGSNAMAAAYQYCGLQVVDESLRFCKAEYAKAGKPQCAQILQQQLDADKQSSDSARALYSQTSTGGAIESNCGF